MRRVVLTCGLLILTASAAVGQTWREAYERGDFAAAAAVLDPFVLDHLNPAPDLDATEALARMYNEGLGVVQERIIGRSFTNLAMGAAMLQYGLTDAACGGLTGGRRVLSRAQLSRCGPIIPA